MESLKLNVSEISPENVKNELLIDLSDCEEAIDEMSFREMGACLKRMRDLNMFKYKIPKSKSGRYVLVTQIMDILEEAVEKY